MTQPPDIADQPDVVDLIRRALAEDLGDDGDITGKAVIPEEARVSARIVTRQDCMSSGSHVAGKVFSEVDPEAATRVLKEDGQRVSSGATLMQVEGSARSILAAERTALNFYQRMTGIATLTRQFVDKVASFNTVILDTRKTTPGLRVLEKYAVHCGGGVNHRMGLYDRMMVKDNHLQFCVGPGRQDPVRLVEQARAAYPGRILEIEVDTVEQFRAVMPAKPDWILLDNMTPSDLKQCVTLCKDRVRLEASGGITLDSVAEVAATGVDAISVGALTHSARAADLSLEFMTANTAIG